MACRPVDECMRSVGAFLLGDMQLADALNCCLLPSSVLCCLADYCASFPVFMLLGLALAEVLALRACVIGCPRTSCGHVGVVSHRLLHAVDA
jgi:hypothetical protein